MGTGNWGHTGATGPDQTHVTGLWAVTATNAPVAVAVNGLPATTSKSGRWWREGVPLYPGTNDIRVAVSSPGTAGFQPASSQILLDNPPVFTYDAAGNMTSDGKNQYTWNDEDRLASVTPVLPRHGDLKLTYTYDYQGRRVHTDRFTFDSTGGGGIPAAGGAWVAASRTFYQYQGWNVVGITQLNPGPGGYYTPAGSVAYAWGVDLSGALQGAGGVGGLLARRDASGSLAEYHYDFNGNVVALADPSAPQLLAEYTYDPFGKRLSASGPLAAANPFRFSTKIEEETGWNYYGYRFYAPELGRWPNRDPIGEEGGVNLFGMVGNCPICRYDIFGLADNGMTDYYNWLQLQVNWMGQPAEPEVMPLDKECPIGTGVCDRPLCRAIENDYNRVAELAKGMFSEIDQLSVPVKKDLAALKTIIHQANFQLSKGTLLNMSEILFDVGGAIIGHKNPILNAWVQYQTFRDVTIHAIARSQNRSPGAPAWTLFDALNLVIVGSAPGIENRVKSINLMQDEYYDFLDELDFIQKTWRDQCCTGPAKN